MDKLPVFAHRNELVTAIKNNQVTIVVGQTGSGKTTQIPQFILEAKLNGSKAICITQPRRVAAISLAARVSKEMGEPCGSTVGYAVRFDTKATNKTRIKFVTDGLLLKEYSSNAFGAYSVIILDEAHERTLRTDILFGLVKRELSKRKDLKVVVMSATLDADRFSSYFNKFVLTLRSANIIHIQGRQFPVRIFNTKSVQTDPCDAALVSIVQVNKTAPLPGDILVFLTGQEEIESTASILEEALKSFTNDMPKIIIRPIYAALSSEKQQKVFEPTPTGCRKVVLCTNIAETSITIPGITVVIDTGLVKTRVYNSKINLETLSTVPISKSSASQRSGRAGRMAPGKCYRLYTNESFLKLDESTEPEIKRTNLASVVLMLKSSGISDIFSFDYMDRPSNSALVGAFQQLFALGALDQKGDLTEVGKSMSVFPLDAPYSRVLVAAKEYGCSEQIVGILACLSVDSIFNTSIDKRDQVGAAMKRFLNHDGDHMTLLNVYNGYIKEGKKDSGWCSEHLIKKRSMKQICDIAAQLKDLCISSGIKMQSTTNAEFVLKCFLAGFCQNVAFRQPDGAYKTLNNQV